MKNLIYGRNSVLSFLSNDNVTKVFLQTGFNDKRILDIVKSKNLEVSYIDLNELNVMTNNGNHQGVVAFIKEFKLSSVKEILNSCKDKPNPLILILDEINDPHNFGAIIRSADAFSVDGIIIKNRNQVSLNSTVAKVSTGALDYVKIAEVNNLNNVVKELKENNFWIYAADGSGKDDYNKVDFSGNVALIMGSEGFGISRLLLENSDFIIKIPMTGHVNSLNVSVATGILLSRIRNK